MKLLTIISLLVLVSCGTNNLSTVAASCPEAATAGCEVLCKTFWDDAQSVPGANRYAGSYYCIGTQAYVTYDRSQGYTLLAAGSYLATQTGLPCNFQLTNVCTVTDQSTETP